MQMTRRVGDWQVPALGTGTWAIGGPFVFDGKQAGWGEVDDAESARALRAAYDGGVRLFDTADVYGCGHSERVLGAALADVRDDVVIATKGGLLFDESTRTGAGSDVSPAHLRAACEASLRRLGTDRIDLYQLHPGDAPLPMIEDVVATFDALVDEGKVRAYGTSAPEPAIIDLFAKGRAAVAVQQELNVFSQNEPALRACDEYDLAVLARTPLAMGLLSGRYRQPSDLDADDVRRNTPHWDWFRPEEMPRWVARVDAVREVLTSGGRTPVQGALAYVWGRSARAVALPGVRAVVQAVEQAGALAYGPLTPAQVTEVDNLLARDTAA